MAIGEVAITVLKDTALGHTNVKQFFWNPLNGREFAALPRNTTDDWFLWVQDFNGETTGEFAGNNGDWSLALDNLGNPINLDTRASCRPDLFFDPIAKRLTVLRMHATGYIDQYNWDSATNRFNLDATKNTISVGHINPGANNNHASHIIDSLGQYQVQFNHTNDPRRQMVRQSNTSWTTSNFITLESDIGDEADTRGDICTWFKEVGGVAKPHSGIVYKNRINQEVRFAYKDDDDANSIGNWTFETVETSAMVDNHCMVLPYLIPGDKTSQLFVARKAEELGIQSVVVQRRNRLGVWTDKVILETLDKYSRPFLTLDPINDELYCYYVDNEIGSTDFGIFFRKCNIYDWVWSPTRTKVLESTGVNSFLSPKGTRYANPISGITICGFDKDATNGELWMNEIAIPRPYQTPMIMI